MAVGPRMTTGTRFADETQRLVGGMKPAPSFGGAPYHLPAFPGAEGEGSDTNHGRFGRVLFIDNLNDSGAGSARQALAVETGPRIVIPRVSGTIGCNTYLKIRGPVYLAGQAAPGDGLCFAGNGLQVQGKDILVRHIRARSGDDQGAGIPPADGRWENRKTVQIGDPDDIGGTERWMLDHCSLSWGVDSNCTPLYRTHHGTISYCILSEALMNSQHPEGPHAMTLDLALGHVGPISLHHSVLAHSNQRMPQISGDCKLDMRCNLAYNWRQFPFETKNPDNQINFVNNAYIYGLDRIDPITGVIVVVESDVGLQLYARGNSDPRGPLGFTSNLDNWPMLQTIGGEQIPDRFKPGHFMDRPFAWAPVTTQTIPQWLPLVGLGAGATKPKRDSVDDRIINQIQSAIAGNPTGHLIDSQEDVGGWPTLHSTTPPTDTDQDGVPDTYAQSLGFSANSNCANRVIEGSPYTIIERYLSSLAGDQQG
jgi:hypothetical protein